MVIDEDREGRQVSQFPPDPRSAIRARALIRSALEGFPEPFVHDVVLVASELVSNAITHARTPFEFTITTAGSVVRVAVTDSGGGQPAIPEPPPSVGGLGLRIVDRVATRWGTRKEGRATTVWFEAEAVPTF